MTAEETRRKLVELEYDLRQAFECELRRCCRKLFGPVPTAREVGLQLDMNNFFMAAIHGYINAVLHGFFFDGRHEEE